MFRVLILSALMSVGLGLGFGSWLAGSDEGQEAGLVPPLSKVTVWEAVGSASIPLSPLLGVITPVGWACEIVKHMSENSLDKAGPRRTERVEEGATSLTTSESLSFPLETSGTPSVLCGFVGGSRKDLHGALLTRGHF